MSRYSPDDNRRIVLANLKLNSAINSLMDHDFEAAQESILSLNDLVDALGDEAESERLRGLAHWIMQDRPKAVLHFEKSYQIANDLRALIYLSFLAPDTARSVVSEVDRHNLESLLKHKYEQMDSFFGFLVLRSQLITQDLLARDGLLFSIETLEQLAQLYGEVALDENYDFDELEMRNPKQVWSIKIARARRKWLTGDNGSLLELLALGAHEPDALAVLAEILIPFSETYDRKTPAGQVNDVDIRFLGKRPQDFAMKLMEQAHEAGSLRASAFLAAQNYDSGWLEEIESILRRLVPKEQSPLQLTLSLGGPVAVLMANQKLEEGNDLDALRVWRDVASSALDRAGSGIGEMLLREADGRGPWALLGDYLSRWGLGSGDNQNPLKSNEVGSHDYPLIQRAVTPDFLMPQGAPSADISRRVKRLMDALEQNDVRAEVIGDSIQAPWMHDQGPIRVTMKVVHSLDGYFVQIFLPMLIANRPPDVLEIPNQDELLAQVRNSEVIDASGISISELADGWFHGISHKHFGLTRASLEALFQLGENGSRDVWFNQWFNLHRFIGRYATFASPLTDGFFPSAWFAAVTVDSIGPWMEGRPSGLRFPKKGVAMFVGYEFSADQSAPRLRDDAMGAIRSVYSMSHLASEMFETQPEVFEELFGGVPALKAHDHLEEIGAESRGGAWGPMSKGSGAYMGLFRREMAQSLADANDGLSQNNAGSHFLSVGEETKALVCFENAAQVGIPNALSSLVWLNTNLDRHREAIQAFEEYFSRATQYIDYLKGVQVSPTQVIPEVQLEADNALRSLEEAENLSQNEKELLLEESINSFLTQLPNTINNVAISYFALGQADQANELWAQVADDHYEAPLFMALAAQRQGQKLDGLPPIDPEKLSSLVEDCDSALRHAVGWSKQWYEDSRALVTSMQKN